MRLLIILLTMMFYSTGVFSVEKIDCSSIKKTSPKYLLCKTKSAGSSIKNIFTKKENGEKKSFFKKFKNAKSLSDLAK